ncbi:hypothetical protein AYX13_07049 [Cryptococcus neoformans]|nr:hypothetical protein AYX13_07049 [Cryptococcus neoformans var. grubii]
MAELFHLPRPLSSVETNLTREYRNKVESSIIKMVHRQPAVLTHATFYPFQGPEPLIQASSVFPSPARSYIMLPELATPRAKRTP